MDNLLKIRDFSKTSAEGEKAKTNTNRLGMRLCTLHHINNITLFVGRFPGNLSMLLEVEKWILILRTKERKNLLLKNVKW